MIAARAMGDALRAALNEDDRVILLGEDLVDPYGGAFKVTRGLSTDFPGRVRSTPISEGAIAGLSAGLALSGYRPIAEIMFGDFLTLCFDQIVNHIAKYEAMYNGKVTCPVIIRTPSGGGRGYGPTHSQSLEKHFFGVPHLRVVASSLVHDPAAVLRALLAQDSPVLLIEHKLLYPLHLMLPAGGRIEGDIAEEHVSRRRPADGVDPAGAARGLLVHRAGLRLPGRAGAARALAARGRGGDLRRARRPQPDLTARTGSRSTPPSASRAACS